ncbi:MAG: serine hydrolase domain-containing protein [Pseudomonadota bacterium]
MKALLSTLVLAASFAVAQHGAARVELDPAALEAWGSAYFDEQLALRNLSGAGISVVQDGQLVFSRGYGYEDFGKDVAFDPAETRVRVCSNSKLFTATATAKLWETGAIEALSDPANRYLKRIQLPAYDGEDITIRDLMTHRAGYGAAAYGAGTDRDVPERSSLADIERRMPSQTVAPGIVSSYANAALAIQGLLIEDLTGKTVREYLQELIFDPLGMSRSLYHFEMGAPERLALPYRFYPDGSTEAVKYIPKHPLYAPSGGVVATPNDMAKFLVAHADEGRAAPAPILAPETFVAMHTQQVTNHPGLPGLGLQFATNTLNGERMASHGCGLEGYTNSFVVLPDSNAGIFIAVVAAPKLLTLGENLGQLLAPARMQPSSGCCTAGPLNSAAVFDALVEAIIGPLEEHASLPVLAEAERHPLTDYAGYYVSYRSVEGNVLRLLRGAHQFAVSEHPEGGLRVGGQGPYLEVAPDLFQHQGDPAKRAAFMRDENGLVARISTGSWSALGKTGWLDSPQNFGLALAPLLLLSLSGMTGLRWPRSARRQRLAALLPTLIVLSFVAIGLGAFGFFDTQDLIKHIGDYRTVAGETRFWIVVLASNALFLCCLLMPYCAYASFRDGYWGAGLRGGVRRLHYALIALSALVAIPFLITFDLVGLQLPWL